MPSTSLRRAALPVLLLGAVALAGCGPAPWAVGASETPTPTAPSASFSTPVPNDLSGGSTQRTLKAGAVTASVNYWSTLSMDRWTASAVKPVSLSLTTTVTPDDGKKVYLQRATMQAVPSGPTGSLPPLDPQIDASPTSQTGYAVLSPSSYSQTFNVGPVPAESTSVTIQFTCEFLVQTTPTSTEYAKQTASDTLVVAIAH